MKIYAKAHVMFTDNTNGKRFEMVIGVPVRTVHFFGKILTPMQKATEIIKQNIYNNSDKLFVNFTVDEVNNIIFEKDGKTFVW